MLTPLLLLLIFFSCYKPQCRRRSNVMCHMCTYVAQLHGVSTFSRARYPVDLWILRATVPQRCLGSSSGASSNELLCIYYYNNKIDRKCSEFITTKSWEKCMCLLITFLAFLELNLTCAGATVCRVFEI